MTTTSAPLPPASTLAKSRDGLAARMADPLFNIVTVGILVIAVMMIIYPLYFIVIASVSDPNLIAQGKVWLLPQGFTGLAEQRDALLPKVLDLIHAAHDAGRPVILVRTQHERDRSTWTLNMLKDDQGFAFPGTAEAQFVNGVADVPHVEIVKTRDSAFHGTDLRDQLELLASPGCCSAASPRTAASPRPRPTRSPTTSTSPSPSMPSHPRTRSWPGLCWSSSGRRCDSRPSPRPTAWLCSREVAPRRREPGIRWT